MFNRGVDGRFRAADPAHGWHDALYGPVVAAGLGLAGLALGWDYMNPWTPKSQMKGSGFDAEMRNKMTGQSFNHRYRVPLRLESGMPRFGGSYTTSSVRRAPRRAMPARPRYRKPSYKPRGWGGVRRRTRRAPYRRRRRRTYARRRFWY